MATSWSNQSKNSATWTNETKVNSPSFLLKEDSDNLLTESSGNLLKEGSVVVWSNQSKN